MRHATSQKTCRKLHPGAVAEGNIGAREELTHPGVALRQNDKMGIGVHHQHLALRCRSLHHPRRDHVAMQVMHPKAHDLDDVGLGAGHDGGRAWGSEPVRRRGGKCMIRRHFY